MSFRDLKVGDRVMRVFGQEPSTTTMPMEVMVVEENILRCSALDTKHWPPEEWWSFDRDAGCEEDPELGWGKKFGVTGSQLKKVQG